MYLRFRRGLKLHGPFIHILHVKFIVYAYTYVYMASKDLKKKYKDQSWNWVLFTRLTGPLYYALQASQRVTDMHGLDVGKLADFL